jgi:hypothetical protein
VHHWQAVQHPDGKVTLKVAASKPLGGVAHEELQRNFKRYLQGLDIRVEQVPEIPVGANGKRRTVLLEEA